MSSRKRASSKTDIRTPAKRAYARRYTNTMRSLTRFGDRQPVVEQNFIDVAAASYAADTTGTVTLLNGVAQGDDNTNRKGRQVAFTSVSIKGFLTPVDGSIATTFCRMIVVWDSAPNGVAPVITDLLTASTSLAHMQLNNRARFKILADEQLTIGTVDTTATTTYALAPGCHTVNRYIKLPKVVTTYQGTGATVASIQQGALWLFTIGNNAANAGGTFGLAIRCRFTDL